MKRESYPIDGLIGSFDLPVQVTRAALQKYFGGNGLPDMFFLLSDEMPPEYFRKFIESRRERAEKLSGDSYSAGELLARGIPVPTNYRGDVHVNDVLKFYESVISDLASGRIIPEIQAVDEKTHKTPWTLSEDQFTNFVLESGPSPENKEFVYKAEQEEPPVRRSARKHEEYKPLGGSESIEDTFRLYKKTNDVDLRNALIEKYIPLVRYHAERLILKLPKKIEVDDLISAGIFGLMDAIDGFDPDRGIKFKTYCQLRIRGEMLDELRREDWVPRLVRSNETKIANALKFLDKEGITNPNYYDVANKLGLSPSEYMKMEEEAGPVLVYSLSDKWDDHADSEDDLNEKIFFIEDEKAMEPSEILNKSEFFNLLTGNLGKKEKLVLLMIYYGDSLMHEIGYDLNITESRVCQIRSNAIDKLKRRLPENYKEMATRTA
jgi:RNA polymerase sigma factor for flagellar operon FliA